MISEVARPHHLIDGFVECGMLDAETKQCPDLDKILSTCHRHMSIEEYQLCKSTFTELYHLHQENGHVSDNDYERLGFERDRDISGNETRRSAGISRECMQRAKCLSHKHQRTLREQLRSEITALRMAKQLNIVEKVHSILTLNKMVEDHVNAKIQGRDGDVTLGFQQATIADFWKPTVPQLKAFIRCRLFPTLDGPRVNGYKWIKKDTIESCADPAHDCLLRRAYNKRMLPILLKPPMETQNVLLSDDVHEPLVKEAVVEESDSEED